MVGIRPLAWVGSAKRDLMALPKQVVRELGYALHLAQIGRAHPHAKALKGFRSAGVLEIAEDWRGDTYRAVYTVRFEARVFVLHVFQKKAKSGIATPKRDIELIRARLSAAQAIAKELADEEASKS